jgi:hypothetical protein
VNTYAGLATILQAIRATGPGPTSWPNSPTGHWKAPRPGKPRWRRPAARKPPSTSSRYESRPKTKSAVPIYTYVFWGQKQERTPTWYGLSPRTARSRGSGRDAVPVSRAVARQPRPAPGRFQLAGKRRPTTSSLQPGRVPCAGGCVTRIRPPHLPLSCCRKAPT